MSPIRWEPRFIFVVLPGLILTSFGLGIKLNGPRWHCDLSVVSRDRHLVGGIAIIPGTIAN